MKNTKIEKNMKHRTTAKAENTERSGNPLLLSPENLDSVECAAIGNLVFGLTMRRMALNLFKHKNDNDDTDDTVRCPSISPFLSDDDDEDIDPFDAMNDDDVGGDEDDDDDPEDDDDAEERELSATNDFLHKHFKRDKDGDSVMYPRAKCADGYSVSIQGWKGEGCWPNEDNVDYTHVTVLTPTFPDDELQPYRKDMKDEHAVIYSFVPVSVMDKVLEKHGGIVGTEENRIVLDLLCAKRGWVKKAQMPA